MHDFQRFPELTNSQMSIYYFDSPHKQIFSDFNATVVSVHDGDTIKVRWSERDFDFPVRFSNISARELKETEERDTSDQRSEAGKVSKKWLEDLVLNKEVTIKIDSNNRVEKFGRLLGRVELGGMDVGELSIMNNMSTSWATKNDGVIPHFRGVKI